ncbi:hypothetical protein D1872_308880 [compost metagenome]
MNADFGPRRIDLIQQQLRILVEPVGLGARIVIAEPPERRRCRVYVGKLGGHGKVAFIYAVRVNADRTGGIFGYGVAENERVGR